MKRFLCHHRPIFLALTLIAFTIHFACSNNAEQAGSQAIPSTELKAKIVYYAMPG